MVVWMVSSVMAIDRKRLLESGSTEVAFRFLILVYSTPTHTFPTPLPNKTKNRIDILCCDTKKIQDVTVKLDIPVGRSCADFSLCGFPLAPFYSGLPIGPLLHDEVLPTRSCL